MRYSFTAIIVCALFGASNTSAQKRSPEFMDYPARVVQLRRSVKIHIHTTPYTACYRTMLRKAAREGQLFAGHYSLGYWGCGTCIRLGIVDLVTGRSYVTPFIVSSAQGIIKVKSNSRLVVIDDVENPDGHLYYQWTGRNLLQILNGKVNRRESKPDFERCAEMTRSR
jgi:hypothetical protein